VKFILATTDPLKLPATILSRTQHFRFKSIATNKIVDHLAHILQLEGIEYETDALEILARSGSGSLRDTLTLLDQAIIYSKNHVDVRTVTDMLGLVDPKFIDELFDSVFAKDYGALVAKTKVLEDYESEMVVDELIAYLKEKMYNHDSLFSTLVLDRFFRILSDSKYLFSVNADGSFVLSLIFFKMVEALRIREIDQMIESFQKDVERPQILVPQTPSIKIQSATPEMAPEVIKEEPLVEPGQKQSLEVVKTPQVEVPQEVVAINPHQLTFDSLVSKISDRNAQLGECFTKNIEFISYEDNVLTWESCANEECKKALKHGYGVIKQLVREVFSFETQIKGVTCSKEIAKKEPEQNTSVHDAIATAQGPQTTSMIEDVEVGGNTSCATNCDDPAPLDETNGVDITQEPMVARAIEMFEAKKVTVQSKI